MLLSFQSELLNHEYDTQMFDNTSLIKGWNHMVIGSYDVTQIDYRAGLPGTGPGPLDQNLCVK